MWAGIFLRSVSDELYRGSQRYHRAGSARPDLLGGWCHRDTGHPLSIRIYAGKASESEWMRRPGNAACVWVGDHPSQYDYSFVEGRDVWVFLAGFIKREDVSVITNACDDAGAERLVVVRSDEIVDASWHEEHDYL